MIQTLIAYLASQSTASVDASGKVLRQSKLLEIVRSNLHDGFMVQCQYIDQYSELVGMVVAFVVSVVVRYRFGQELRLSVIGVSFIVQMSLELISDIADALFQAGLLGFRKKTALWRLHLAKYTYLRHSATVAMGIPLFVGLWLQSAVQSQ